MKFLTAAISLCITIVVYSVSAAMINRADVDKSDWKYAVGWDGVTLPADAFGTSIAANGTSSDLEKRALGGVYICTDINWGGHCGYAVQPLGVCVVLGSEWAYQISSLGPDKCTECWAWTNLDCGGTETWAFDYPGDATGGLNLPEPFNDAIGSFKCLQGRC